MSTSIELWLRRFLGVLVMPVVVTRHYRHWRAYTEPRRPDLATYSRRRALGIALLLWTCNWWRDWDAWIKAQEPKDRR